MNEELKKALQEQIKEIQNEGVRNIGYSYNAFKKLDINWLFELLADNVNEESISQGIKGYQFADIALQAYINDIDLDDDLDLIDFSHFSNCFFNYNRTHKKIMEIEEIE